MSRVDDDKAKLVEAVGIFRIRGALHGSSGDVALVRWAHEGGKKKPYADMVREAWHDYAQARHYASLPVSDYRIEYQQAGLFDGEKADGQEPPPPGESSEPAGGDPVFGERASKSDVAAGPSPDPFCKHVPVNDGKTVVCDTCGEVLEVPEEAPVEHEALTNPKAEPKKKSTRKKTTQRKAPPPADDQEEILF